MTTPLKGLPSALEASGAPPEQKATAAADAGRNVVPDLEEALRFGAAVDWQSALPARAASWQWRLAQGVKRILDVVLSATALVLLVPVFALIAIAVVIDSRGPIFYRWNVLGYRGRFFTGYKFRTMVPNADALKEDLMHLNEMDGPVFKIRLDPRVTGIGRFLRRFSLDELPQFWSVLLGDMSLVGPRPTSPGEFVEFSPSQRRKLSVIPGITCTWQVSGRSEISAIDDWIALDLRYIQDWSLWLDVVILWRTIGAVLSRRGAY